jgi:hypothetical protein
VAYKTAPFPSEARTDAARLYRLSPEGRESCWRTTPPDHSVTRDSLCSKFPGADGRPSPLPMRTIMACNRDLFRVRSQKSAPEKILTNPCRSSRATVQRRDDPAGVNQGTWKSESTIRIFRMGVGKYLLWSEPLIPLNSWPA